MSPAAHQREHRVLAAGQRAVRAVAVIVAPMIGGTGPSAVVWAQELLEAGRGILADADRQGVRLSNAHLARRLGEQGYTIANARVGELAGAVRESVCFARGMR